MTRRLTSVLTVLLVGLLGAVAHGAEIDPTKAVTEVFAAYRKALEKGNGDGAIAAWGQVWTANTGEVGGLEHNGEVGEPVRIGIGIVVDVGDDLAQSRV